MAKKKKIVIEDKELTPTVLASLNNKKTNLLGLIILFILFGGIVFYLPEISAYLEPYFKNNALENSNTPSDNQDSNQETEDKEKIIEYPFSSELVIAETDFDLKSFTIVDNKLNLQIENKNATTLDLDNYKYFLQLYSSDDTLLQRIKVDDLVIGANSSKNVSYELDKNNISYITFYEIGIDEYPNHVQIQNLDKEATLTCRKDNRQINYLLLENKLYAIEDLFEVANTDLDYANLYTEYQAKAVSYNNIRGINSSVVVDVGYLKFSTYIDLSVEGTDKVNDITYPKDTDAKVMYFELLSKGYRCE